MFMKKIQRYLITPVFLLLAAIFVVVSGPIDVIAQGATPSPMGGQPVTQDVLDTFNPIKRFSSHPDKLETPGAIISYFLADFAFYLAGIILFVMLIWGGFEMIAGAANKKSLDAGKQRVTAALIGFLILFSVYWLARILESIFNIEILF